MEKIPDMMGGTEPDIEEFASLEKPPLGTECTAFFILPYPNR